MPATPFQNDAVQLVKDAADIIQVIGEYINLQRTGANYKGLCPFHGEKTPSFIVNPVRRTFHCFGCSEGGDVISFFMKYHNLPFPDALKELARRYQVALPERELSAADRAMVKQRETLYAINEKAAGIYQDYLHNSPQAVKARNYLHERGIASAVIKQFRLGYAPDSWNFLGNSLAKQFAPEEICNAGLLVRKDKGGYYDRFRNRVLFPIFSMTGKVAGFGGRILGEGQPKYLNSPETLVFDKGKILFGLYQNKDQIREKQKGIIVEGNFDLLSLVNHGMKHVTAPLGTALTQHHIRALKGYAQEVILLFDGDAAGLKAAMRAVPLFLTEQITAKVVVMPAQHDPDTFLKEYGGKALEELLDQATSLPEFVFDNLVTKYGLSLEGKGKVLAELKPMIEAIGNQQLQRTVFVSHFCQKLGLSPEDLSGGLQQNTRSARIQTDKGTGGLMRISQKQKQLLEFLISFPEFLPSLLAAGIEEVVDTPSGRVILDHIKKLAENNPVFQPELLLDILPSGAERTFVSGLLVACPSYSEDMKEKEAQEKIAWLKKHSVTMKKKRLLEKIKEADKNNNHPLLMELMEEKKRIDNALAS